MNQKKDASLVNLRDTNKHSYLFTLKKYNGQGANKNTKS